MNDTLKDVSAERAVLAGIYSHGSDSYLDIVDIVTPGTFADEINAAIFTVLTHGLKDNPSGKLDPATVMASATQLGLSRLLDKPDERDMLRAVMNLPIQPGNVRRMAGKIARLATTRTLGKTLDEAKANLLKVTGDEPIAHILGLVEKPIIDFSTLLNTTYDHEPKLISDGLRNWLTILRSHPVDQVGLATGFPQFDKAIGGGLRRKTVNVIGARPKVGKSLYAVAVAMYVAGKLGIPVLMLDTEMSTEDQWTRLIAKFARVEIDDVETGKFSLDPEKDRRVEEATKFLESAPFSYLSIAGMPFEDTIATMRRWTLRKVGLQDNGRTKDCLIIFDYLKLMSSEGVNEALKEYQILGFMMTGLHNFVHRHDLPCLAFVQLNRDGIDRESTDVVSQSDRIIWLCSNFSIYKKKSEEEEAEERADGHKIIARRKLVPIVQRHGAGIEDGDWINYKFEGQYANIEELGLRSAMKQNKNEFEVNDNGKAVEF